MRTIFFGSSSYCLPLAVSLHKNTDLMAVITRPDSTFGRNKAILPSPIKTYAKGNQIKYFISSNRNKLISLIDVLKNLKPDIAIVADYGFIIPPDVFNIPRFKTLNVHFGKLPDYRGASPLQWSIANSEKNIPISIILMDAGLDTGDIIAEINYETKGNETTGELYPQFFNLVSDHIPKIIDDFTKGNIKPYKQSDKSIFLTKRLTRNDGFIPFSMFTSALDSSSFWQMNKVNASRISVHSNKHRSWTSQDDIKALSPIAQSALSHCKIVSLSIFNLYRALSPWPGLWTIIEMKQLNHETMIQKKRLKILEMKLIPDPCTLIPLSVQLEGKKPVSWEQFREAYLPLNKPD